MDLEVFVRADDYEEDYLFDLVMKMFDKNAILNVGFEDKYATFSLDDRTLGSVKVETELESDSKFLSLVYLPGDAS